jgi:protein-S-isoprenylcysteine O-methyltransferase Ste14
MDGADRGAVGFLRQLFAIVALPFTMAVLIPFWLARQHAIPLGVGSSPGPVVLQAAGLCLMAVGGLLFVASLRHFATEGQGTLAPWDPPRRLVVRGPYRYVRNPMIAGVVLVLFGEALLLLSRPHLTWALVFWGINSLYIPLLEEPLLAQRFGAAYREYCAHVRRIFPRLTPWDPEAEASARAAELATYRRRLEAPDWSVVEARTAGRASTPLRRLYGDRELRQRTDFWVRDPSRPADPVTRWHIDRFQPADAATLSDEWNELLPSGAFPFATDYVGDLHFVVLNADGRDGPVMHWYHDGGGLEEVAPSLEVFLAWPWEEEGPSRART